MGGSFVWVKYGRKIYAHKTKTNAGKTTSADLLWSGIGMPDSVRRGGSTAGYGGRTTYSAGRNGSDSWF